MASSTFRFHGESQLLDAQARTSAPGKLIKLSDGFTHYEIAGPRNAPVVVLVHGFSVPYYIWDPTFTALVDAGFRVLRYDLYGRGYSDRPRVLYDEILFERQLFELIRALGLSSPVHLIGLSMGGPISVVFTDRHPGMVDKLCLIDPAGFPLNHSIGVKLLQIPLLGEWLIDQFGEKFLVSNLITDFYNPEDFPGYQEKYLEQMRYIGFRQALLSTLRSGLLSDKVEFYQRVGDQSRAILLIWGREDRTIPFSTSTQAIEALPQAEFHPIDEAGHIPHYEKPDIVTPLLINFLRR